MWRVLLLLLYVVVATSNLRSELSLEGDGFEVEENGVTTSASTTVDDQMLGSFVAKGGGGGGKGGGGKGGGGKGGKGKAGKGKAGKGKAGKGKAGKGKAGKGKAGKGKAGKGMTHKELDSFEVEENGVTTSASTTVDDQMLGSFVAKGGGGGKGGGGKGGGGKGGKGGGGKGGKGKGGKGKVAVKKLEMFLGEESDEYIKEDGILEETEEQVNEVLDEQVEELMNNFVEDVEEVEEQEQQIDEQNVDSFEEEEIDIVTTNAGLQEISSSDIFPLPSNVGPIDVNKYMGRWFQVFSSIIPTTTFERGLVCICADYELLTSTEDDFTNQASFKLTNSGRLLNPVSGKAKKVTGTSTNKIREEIPPLDGLWFVEINGMYGTYVIQAVGGPVEGKYPWAIVSDIGRLSIFILARNVKEFKENFEEEALNKAEELGFDKFWNKPLKSYQPSKCKYPGV